MIVREGLALLLAQEADFTVIGEAETGQQAVTLSNELKPDIIVMDIAILHLNGIEATKRILESRPSTRVIILSMYQNKEYISQALRAGAVGYLLKSNSPSMLVEAIRHVYQGKRYLTPEISQIVIDDYVQHSEKLEALQNFTNPLSNREREVLQLIAEGNTSKSIAITLQISLKTIENHRRNMMQKLNIHNTAGLVQYAIRHGILPIGKDVDDMTASDSQENHEQQEAKKLNNKDN